MENLVALDLFENLRPSRVFNAEYFKLCYENSTKGISMKNYLG